MHFLHIAPLSDFTVSKNVADVSGRHGLVDIEKFGDLGLRRPNRLRLGVGPQFYRPVLRLVNNRILIVTYSPYVKYYQQYTHLFWGYVGKSEEIEAGLKMLPNVVNRDCKLSYHSSGQRFGTQSDDLTPK